MNGPYYTRKLLCTVSMIAQWMFRKPHLGRVLLRSTYLTFARRKLWIFLHVLFFTESLIYARLVVYVVSSAFIDSHEHSTVRVVLRWDSSWASVYYHTRQSKSRLHIRRQGCFCSVSRTARKHFSHHWTLCWLAFVALFHRHDRSTAQVVLRWALQSNIGVLPRSQSRDRIRKNIDVFDFELTSADMESINALNGAFVTS